MKRNCKSIFPNHFRIKNPVNLEIRKIPVQTVNEKIIDEINKELAA